MCLLLRIAGQVSSAKAPERTRSSNNFLHEDKNIKQIAVKKIIIQRMADHLISGQMQTILQIHTCHHGLGLPILHHGKWHNMDLVSIYKPITNKIQNKHS